MAYSTDRRPPLPYIPATDAAELENIWNDAPRLLRALNGAKLGAWYWDIESGAISWSKGAQAIFGFDAEHPLPKPIDYIELLPEDDRITVFQLFEQFLHNEPVRRTLRHRITLPDGSLRWIEISGSMQQDANGKARVMGVVRDITQEQEQEQALRISEDKFSKAFYYTPNAGVITSLEDGRFMEVNQAFEQQFGWTAKEAIGRTSIELNIWVNLEERSRMIEAARNNQLKGVEVHLKDRSGNIHLNQIFGGLITLNNTLCLVLSIRDITQQRQQEEELKDSQERLNLALSSANLGTWEWHIPSNMLFGSARAAQLHGLPEKPFCDDFRAFFNFVPIEDRREMRQHYYELQRGIRQHYQATYRSIHADQGVRYLESTAKLYRNAKGEPERMAGILIDITERVIREQNLAASEAKFYSLFQASPDPVTLTTLPEGVALEINSSFTQTFGWTPEEVLGRTMTDVKLWASLEQRQSLFEKVSQNHRLDNEVTEFLDKKGNRITCVISSRAIMINDRLCLLSTFRDITQLQKAQAELNASQEKFALAFHSSPDAITISERETGRYLEVNEGFCRLTGYSAEEVLGRTSEDLNIWVYPHERQVMVQRVVEEGHVYHMEMHGRQRGGKIKVVEVSVKPIQLHGTPCLLLTARDISELKEAQAQVQHLAYHDPLTNLPNRALLLDRLTQQIALLKRHDLRAALLFIDLDHFKHINDSLGHPVGDAVLKQITARLSTCVREEDTVARLGGDEFVILISGLEGRRTTVLKQVREIAEKIRLILTEPMLVDSHQLRVTPSIGIALIPDHGDNPDDLLKRADIALYQAKDGGRNTIELFHESMQQAASDRLRLENELRQALAHHEFQLYFQPQINASENLIVGCEVLLRWKHPTLGLQSPALFIHVLEESGLIAEVGNWVLSKACHDCTQLLQQGAINEAEFRLCVNISPRQFRQPDFVEQVENTLRASQLPAHMLKLEITESIVIQHIDDTIAKMHQLKRLGINFAMDDFGTGYSSLTYLKRLPVNTLKIDQSFVRDAVLDPNDAGIIRAIIAMAHSLGLDVVAEGVERVDQLQFLQLQGCNHYQGYLFSKPVPFDQFVQLLDDNRLPSPL